jgi:hypothetical protein
VDPADEKPGLKPAAVDKARVRGFETREILTNIARPCSEYCNELKINKIVK